MSDRSLRDGLHALVEDEPPLHADVTPIVHEGARLRRRRRLGYAAAALGVTALVGTAIAVPVVLAHDDSSRLGTIAVEPFAPAGTDDEQPDPTYQGPFTERQAAIAKAIIDASPADWTFDLRPDRWDGNHDVEGVVNDGNGDGRLLLGVSKPVGSQIVYPCEDSEFVQGGSCTERTLASGAVLTTRGLVDYKQIKTIEVVLTYPDGSGVGAEAANFFIDWPPPYVITPEQKRNLVTPSRADPVYTTEQLAKVVLAVDRVTR